MTGNVTRERIAEAAMRLFEEKGFDAVTVDEVAAAAGVSHMTVFRHFRTKEDLVVADPFDPVIADLVAAQPTSLPPFTRARLGLLDAGRFLDLLPPEALASVDRRMRLTASHPRLRARMWEGNHDTAQAIATVLRDGGATPLEAAAAAGACLGALTMALLHWTTNSEGMAIGEAVVAALTAIGGER